MKEENVDFPMTDIASDALREQSLRIAIVEFICSFICPLIDVLCFRPKGAAFLSAIVVRHVGARVFGVLCQPARIDTNKNAVATLELPGYVSH